MKPVMQTKFGYPDGNCLAACIASVFEVDIDSIPSFGIRSDWYDKFTDYMVATFGLQPYDLDYESLSMQPRGYHFIAGLSPRIEGRHHAIVGYNGEPVHDPFHGGNCELVERTSVTVFVKVLEE